MDDGTQASLESKFARLKASAKIEFAVVTVETTGGRDIFEYSLAVARGWGVGPPAGADGGGLLLLFAVKESRWRLQVSRSLEADLPDDVAAELGAVMTPSLRAGRYGEAADRFADAIIRRLGERRGFSTKELLPEAQHEESPKAAGRPEAAP
ncbi:MAG: TPM domain-containing protein [Pyrinomonadaceae bacterium]